MRVIFQTVQVEATPENPNKLAKTIYDMLRWQYQMALRLEVDERCKLNGFKAANEAAEREYKESQEMGFGAKLPYTEQVIKMQAERAAEALENLNGHRQLLDFFVLHFIDEAITPDPSPLK
jgi:hypothetical protein